MLVKIDFVVFGHFQNFLHEKSWTFKPKQYKNSSQMLSKGAQVEKVRHISRASLDAKKPKGRKPAGLKGGE